MATVIKRGKKWYAKFVDHNGKQVMRVGYSDKRASELMGRRLEDEARAIRNGDVDPQVEARRIERARRIGEHLDDYEASLTAANRDPHYIKYTRADIQKLIDRTAVTSAAAITRPMIDAWVADLRLADSNKTVNRRVSSVQGFLRWLKEIGGVSEYTLLKYPKLPTGKAHQRRTYRVLTSAEATSLIAGTRKPERRELYQFALKSGLRLKECRGLLAKYVDLEHRVIHVPADLAKARRDQSVPIHPELLEMLTRRVAERAPDQPLFPDIPVHKAVVRNLRLDCKRLDIPTTNVSFHSFRHSYCTNLARAGVHPALLQRLARHADLATTLKFYTHLNRDDEAAAIAKA